MPATEPSMRVHAFGSGEAKKPSCTSSPEATACQSSGMRAVTSPAVTCAKGLGERWIVRGRLTSAVGAPTSPQLAAASVSTRPAKHTS
jgi:hypothetical protein